MRDDRLHGANGKNLPLAAGMAGSGFDGIDFCLPYAVD
jgi:hypothetical protein